MQSLSEILGVGILTHACGKGRNSAQNLPFGRKLSGCRKGDACPGDVVWEASPSHLQGAGFGAGGEVPVAPVDPPRITCAGISLSPSGVVGSGEGSASLLWSNGRGIGHQETLKKDSPSAQSVVFDSVTPWTVAC